MTTGYSAEEIREHVEEYLRQPHGTKGKWIDGQPFTKRQMDRWRWMVYGGGDVDRSLVPRDASGMKYSSGQLAEFERRRQVERSEHQVEIAKLQARIEELEGANDALEGANDALGKAIGLLHQLNAQGPDTTLTKPRGSS